jgi:hypothetical protein
MYRYGGYPYDGGGGYGYEGYPYDGGGGNGYGVRAPVKAATRGGGYWYGGWTSVKAGTGGGWYGYDIINMAEDTATEVDVEVVEREHGGLVLVKHWTDDGAERRRQPHWERELMKSECWEGLTKFTDWDSNYLILHRVDKRVQTGGNVCEMSSNRKGGIYRVIGDKIWFFWDFFALHDKKWLVFKFKWFVLNSK